ncbi:hypothetical protein Tco_0717297 [Tanacetum coccineum]
MDAMTMKVDAQYKDFQSRSKQSKLDDDDIPMSREEETKFMKTFHRTHFYNELPYAPLFPQTEILAIKRRKILADVATTYELTWDLQADRKPRGSLIPLTRPLTGSQPSLIGGRSVVRWCSGGGPWVGAGTRFSVSTRFRLQGQYEVRISSILEADVASSDWWIQLVYEESELTLRDNIDLLLGEHLDTLSTGDREIDFNPSRDIEELERLLADDLIPVPRVFDEPLGHSDSISRSFDVTFSNLLFDFNDDFTLCNDNPLFDEEFEDISSLDPPESTPFIDESTLLVTPLPDPKQICLREVERFDPFFSLTQSGGTTRVMKTPSFSFHHMPSPHPAAYSPMEVMYRYYHPHLTSGDGFDHGPKMK